MKSGRASAEGADKTEARERCATRLSAAILGRGASAELAANPDPQSAVDAMLKDPQFIERFAGFLNASFNRSPGAKAVEDAPYWLGKYVLEKDLPYKDLFVGGYDVTTNPAGAVVVNTNADGLGYFRSRAWQVRYAGNEETGLKIVTAYRIMNNTVGLELVATTNAPDIDITQAGRAKAPCSSCHFETWSALDLAARVLDRRQGTGDAMKFVPPAATDVPQKIADKNVSNDKELVNALVDSEAFRFNACRLVFKYLYDRPEHACESKVFDACVDSFKATERIQSAIATVAKDPTFCQ